MCLMLPKVFYVVLTPPMSPTSGIGKLQANPPVTDQRISAGNPTRRRITMMGSNDLAIGKNYLLG